MEIEDKHHAFISYAKEDRDMASKIYNDLVRSGVTCWIDNKNIIPGQNWKIEVSRAIKQSSYFLLLLSSNSISKRGFVQKEQKIALELFDEFPQNEIFIIPVRLDNAKPVNEKLQELHWIDLFLSYEKGFNQLLKVLQIKSCQNIPYKDNLSQKESNQYKKSSQLKGESMASIFISAAQHDPDVKVAGAFHKHLENAGHKAFWAATSIKIGENWSERISEELRSCDYFVVLISKNSLHRDMVTEEVRKVKEMQQNRSSDYPVILPVRLNLPFGSDTNYDLAGYLNRIQQRIWENDSDTEVIINEILDVVNNNHIPDLLEQKEVFVLDIKTDDVPPPNAPLELPEGQVRIDSPFYVERVIDKNCFEEILRPGSLIRIKAPRQYGKTSLLSRLIEHSSNHGHKVVSLSLHFLDQTIINNLEKLLKLICNYTASKLKIPPQMEEYWDEYGALKMSCSNYFEEYILENVNSPVILAIDEADRLFSIEHISDDFFSMIRGWHEVSKTNPVWEKLKIILVHSTEAYLAVNNINQSPFYNVGFEAKLPAFNKDEISRLAVMHGIHLNEDELNDILMSIGGHPYLVRRTFYEMANNQISFRDLMDSGTLGESPFGDHLRRSLWNLKEDQNLVDAMSRILNEKSCRDDKTCYLLQAAGLIKGDPPDVEVSCLLYEKYLAKHFIQ